MNETFWTGLYLNDVTGNWTWIEDTMHWWTAWGPGEPKSHMHAVGILNKTNSNYFLQSEPNTTTAKPLCEWSVGTYNQEFCFSY